MYRPIIIRYLIQTFFFLAYSVLQKFNDVLFNDTRSSDIDIMEFVMWQILTYSALLDLPEFRKKPRNRSHIVSQYKDLHRKLNELISNGNKYPYSYLFMFRSVLLDRKQFSDVCAPIFIYYVYRINTYVSYLLLGKPMDQLQYIGK